MRRIRLYLAVAFVVTSALLTLMPLHHSNRATPFTLGQGISISYGSEEYDSSGAICMGISPNERLTIGLPFYVASGWDPQCGELTVNEAYPMAFFANLGITAGIFFGVYALIERKRRKRS